MLVLTYILLRQLTKKLCHKNLNVIIYGATGMIGSGVLIECLEDPNVKSVLIIGRSSAGINDPKGQGAY